MESPLASSSTPLASSPPAGDCPATPLPLQDQKTLSQLKRGNSAAMEDLVARYQDRLFNTLLRMVHHPEDAADLTQETFVRAMQHVATFEGRSSLYTWLFRIAINLALSHRRAGRYRKAASLDRNPGANHQADALHRELAQHTESDPAHEADLRIEHQRLLDALRTLEPDHRAILILRDIEDCDYDQIAAILELPPGTVKSRLFRARAALRDACAAPNPRFARPRTGGAR